MSGGQHGGIRASVRPIDFADRRLTRIFDAGECASANCGEDGSAARGAFSGRRGGRRNAEEISAGLSPERALRASAGKSDRFWFNAGRPNQIKALCESVSHTFEDRPGQVPSVMSLVEADERSASVDV